MDFKYNFKKNPFDHQRDALEEGLLRPEFGYFMEMGTGKSKVLIDNMGMLYLRHDIDFRLGHRTQGRVSKLGGERNTGAHV